MFSLCSKWWCHRIRSIFSVEFNDIIWFNLFNQIYSGLLHIQTLFHKFHLRTKFRPEGSWAKFMFSLFSSWWHHQSCSIVGNYKNWKMNFNKIGVVHGRGPRDGPWTGGQCFQLSPVRHIPIPGVDESQWSKQFFTGGWDVPYWECTSSQEMGMCLTGNAHSLYNYKVKLSWIAFWLCGYFEVGCYKICSVQEQSLWGKPHFYVKIQIFTVGIFKLCPHTDLWQSTSGKISQKCSIFMMFMNSEINNIDLGAFFNRISLWEKFRSTGKNVFC